MAKNNHGRFNFRYRDGEYDKLLKKHKGDVSSLNRELKKRLMSYIESNKDTNYTTHRKAIYISCNECEAIAEFCTRKGISRAFLSDQIKKENSGNK